MKTMSHDPLEQMTYFVWTISIIQVIGSQNLSYSAIFPSIYFILLFIIIIITLINSLFSSISEILALRATL